MAFEGLSAKLSQAFRNLRQKGKLSPEDIKQSMRLVRVALLEADVNFKVAKKFIDDVTLRANGAEVMQSLTPSQAVIKIVHSELVTLMGSENETVKILSRPPTIIMLCGLQGSGKTTHAAKLAKYFAKNGHRPLLVALDIYRPAAIEQLKVMGAKAAVPVFEMGQVSPVEIATKSLSHAKDHGNDIIILDTAGRLHIDDELMSELTAIKAAVTVNETLLVVDAMVGQDAVNVAKRFNELIGIDGIILTKLDGDARGGAAISVKEVTQKPIKFVGVGEKLDDLEPFHPERMAGRILGMGDVMSLIEKAEAMAGDEQQLSTQRMLENKFDMNDMLAQLQQLKKMGGISSILSMMPGAASINPDDIDPKAFSRIEAIIYSMTKKERQRPSIIDPKRKRRIAAGSGTEVFEINRLLKQFEDMSKMMKKFKNNPRSLKNFSKQFGM